MEVKLRSIDDLLHQYSGYRNDTYTLIRDHREYTIIEKMYKYFGNGEKYNMLPATEGWYRFYYDDHCYYMVHGDWFVKEEEDELDKLFKEEL